MWIGEVPKHTGDELEVPLGAAKFVFRRLRWPAEMIVEQLTDGVAKMDKTLSLAIDRVGDYRLSRDEADLVVAKIPRPIRERVYKLYLSITGPERLFTTVPIYKAPELSEALIIEEDEQEEDIDLDRLHEALEESIESQRKIVNNRTVPQELPSLEEDDE